MATKGKSKRDMSEAIHSSATMIHKVGAIDKTTMLDFDARHLIPSEIAPAEIKQLREANNVSQRVFARYPQHERKHGREMGIGREAAQSAITKAPICRPRTRPESPRLTDLRRSR